MGRVAYSASVEDFVNDWNTNRFMGKMCEGAALNHIGGSISEKNSWSANAAKLCSLLSLAKVPDDTYIAFEYKTPLTGRADCMLFGYDRNGVKHIVHIELKQWSNDTVTRVYDSGVFKVSALVGGGYRFQAHPSQQALNYQQNIVNYVTYAGNPENEINGYAYCYNYMFSKNPNDLFLPEFQSVLEACPLSAGDQVLDLAGVLKDALSGGKGEDIFREFVSSPLKPSKDLLNAAANMFRGKQEFVLLDDQLTSSNMIFGMVAKAIADPSRKMVLVVKGGPGTGKTVIALKVLAELCLNYPGVSAYFTTRSKALRNALIDKLDKIAAKEKTSASSLVRDIYDFKPHHFREGEVDVLLVDEAHRVRKSSNVMYDSRDEQTYLPQALSLMYCAKVCVFFIDDHQAINKEEIGNSDELIRYAENYAEEIKKATEDFKDALDKKKSQLANKELLKKKLVKDPDIKKLNKIERSIDNLKAFIAKEYQLADIRSKVSEVDVAGIELTTQFRCGGSDNYLDWLDDVLYNDGKNGVSFGDEYEFRVCDTPSELEQKIRSLDGNGQVARLAAGYCWKWSDRLQPDGDLYKDVKIGDWEMPWETNSLPAKGKFRDRYAPSADLWASHPMGINQVGCIFSAQGFEVDYIGVILGPDIVFDKTTERIRSQKGCTHSVADSDTDHETHIKNIYRVLLSRGRKGCYIYCCDRALAEYFKKIRKQDADSNDVCTGNAKAGDYLYSFDGTQEICKVAEKAE